MTLDELLEELEALKARHPAVGFALVVGVRDPITYNHGTVLVGEPVDDDDEEDDDA